MGTVLSCLLLLAVIVGVAVGPVFLNWTLRRGHSVFVLSLVLAPAVVFIGYALGHQFLPFHAGRWVGMAVSIALCLYTVPGVRRGMIRERHRTQEFVEQARRAVDTVMVLGAAAEQEEYLRREEERARAHLAGRNVFGGPEGEG